MRVLTIRFSETHNKIHFTCMNMHFVNAGNICLQMAQPVREIYEYCMKKLPPRAILSKF